MLQKYFFSLTLLICTVNAVYGEAHRAPRGEETAGIAIQPLDPVPGTNVNGEVERDEHVPRNLYVGGNLTVAGTITGNFAVPFILKPLTGNQACIIFEQSDSFEKARICSSTVFDDKGVFISVDGGTTQNFRVLNSGDSSFANNIDLLNSTATVGNIYKNGTLFLSNFGTNNTFVGSAAGNLTLTGTDNTGFGTNALTALTTGSNNVALGYNAGNALTTESNNIYIGSGQSGTVGDANTIRLGNVGTTQCFVQGINGVNVGSVASVVSLAGNQLGSTTLTAGANITITPGANTITIAAAGGASGITTLDGDSGSATGATVTITGGASGAFFTGAGATLTESFNYLALPDSSTSLLGLITINGIPFLSGYPGTANNNTFVGGNAGNYTNSTSNNTAVGTNALSTMQAGSSYNTAVGFNALMGSNLGIGGSDNVAIGANCLVVAQSSVATAAVGASALAQLITGSNNVAVGQSTLLGLVTGNNNTAIGFSAGSAYQAGNTTNNICIGANQVGVDTENNTTRIGVPGQTAQCFIQGINGVNVGSVASVVSISGDQLGTTTLTAGTNITITPGAHTITIASTGGGTGITTITGDSGSVTGSSVQITGGNSGAVFTGAGAILTESFNYLALPDSTSATLGVITIDGARFVHAAPATASRNTFVGSGTGNFAMNPAATDNSGLGYIALQNITTATDNTGMGSAALATIDQGSRNTGLGSNALSQLEIGSDNVAIGYHALSIMAGNSDANVAIGTNVGSGITGGASNNIIIGGNTTTNSSSPQNRIVIGSGATSGADNEIRVGFGSTASTTCFIDGIRGITTTSVDAIPVLISSTGQLGTVSSSRRYKTNIEPLEDSSDRFMQLNPVEFTYKLDETDTPQWGLIAEEVEDLYPELMVYNNLGAPETVKYHLLYALLIKMVQENRKLINELQARVSTLES